MPSANHWPSEIRLNPARDVLAVAFDSGERFALRAEYLRVESPSAEVRNHGGSSARVEHSSACRVISIYRWHGPGFCHSSKASLDAIGKSNP